MFFKRPLVRPGELLQAGSTIYRLLRRQGQIFVVGAVFGGRPPNGLGWLAGLAGGAGWVYIACRKSSASFIRGPQAVGAAANKEASVT